MTFHHNYPALPRGLGPSGMAQTAAFEVRNTVDIVTLQKNSETNTLLYRVLGHWWICCFDFADQFNYVKEED